MRKRLAKIENNPAVADRIESERIRAFQREFAAAHSGLDREAYEAALAALTHEQLVWLTCPQNGAEFDLTKASDKFIAAFCDGATEGREDELCEELERLRLPAGWKLDNPAGWCREALGRA